MHASWDNSDLAERTPPPATPPHKPPRPGLALEVLPQPFAICCLAPGTAIPAWALAGSWLAIVQSPEELSVICAESQVPADSRGIRVEHGWRAIRVVGPLGDPIIGVVAALAQPLTAAAVSLLAISTFESDYFLVRAQNLLRAIVALERAGHAFSGRHPAAVAPVPAVPPVLPGVPAASPTAVPAAAVPAVPPVLPAVPAVTVPTAMVPAVWTRSAVAQAPSPPPAERRHEEDIYGAADEDAEDDEGAMAEGLFTGAIPQHPVAITDASFASLGLSADLLQALSEVGYQHPTPIQAEVIPQALAGRDVIGLAETGSGKTAAFALPLLEQLPLGSGTRALILCPTREIALQSKAFFDVFSRGQKRGGRPVEILAIIGGVKMNPQIQGLKRGAQVLVATPGRLADHLRRGHVRLEQLQHLVLDEADHMLDLGFLPQIQEILEQIPAERQTLMFSATMPPVIERLTKRFMKDPVRIDFRPLGQAAGGIEHRLYLVKPEDKKACLLALLESVAGSTLVFTRRRLDAEWLSRQLEQEGYPVERIHSDRSQAHRVRALRAFREGHHRVLVATDVAARGIDIPRIEHVVNFELPDQVDDYVHRAGRTARGNAVGIVSSIATWQDKPLVREIEGALGVTLPRCEVPGIQPYAEIKRSAKTVKRRRLL